jgi:DpnII restriction endonuclease
VLVDLRVLTQAVQEEFALKFWSGYEDRRREFNELLDKSASLGVSTPLKYVEGVPENQCAYSGVGSHSEQAKLREIAICAERLLEYVRRDVGTDDDSVGNDEVATLQVVERLCNRFHVVARQLRSRHAGRSTLDVADEYDTQDLFHALLRIHFEDIRPEEFTPSYAGGASRTDFLLKREQCVIEIKKTRISLGARELGEQLLVDIARYASHPDCKLLVCFAYDPDGRIANPRGLESDLEKQETESLRVRVLIRPTDI